MENQFNIPPKRKQIIYSGNRDGATKLVKHPSFTIKLIKPFQKWKFQVDFVSLKMSINKSININDKTQRGMHWLRTATTDNNKNKFFTLSNDWNVKISSLNAIA